MSLETQLNTEITNSSLELNRLLKDFKDKKGNIQINLERALLIVSGIDTERELKKYIGKIDKIHDDFKSYFTSKVEGLKKELKRKDPTSSIDEKSHWLIAKYLHEYLWKTRLYRFDEDASPLLKSVIDAQYSWFGKRKPVGNALGLTSLYTVLGLRSGLDLYVVFESEHTATRLVRKKYGGEVTIIENTRKDGFPGLGERGIKYEEDKEENFRALFSKVYSARERLKEERPGTIYKK